MVKENFECSPSYNFGEISPKPSTYKLLLAKTDLRPPQGAEFSKFPFLMNKMTTHAIYGEGEYFLCAHDIGSGLRS
jgi:hypothetical protein